MNGIDATLEKDARIHLWMRAKDPAVPGVLRLLRQGGGVVDEWVVADTAGFCFCESQVSDEGVYRLDFDSTATELSLVYSFSHPTVHEDGIVVHWTSEANRLSPRRGYHFRPPFGWMNDPNGVCRIDGAYHLFYQHYPHRRRWNNMHWGHAVSPDMVTWVHQPVFLHPPGSLAKRDDAMGGAYSGTIVPADGALQVFFTDHVNHREPEVEFQSRTVSTDGISTDGNIVIVGRRPETIDPSVDFRDPFVFRGPDGKLKMLLGSQSGETGIILLYETSDPTGGSGWAYVGTLHTFSQYPRATSECPCLVPVRGGGRDRWVLVASLKQSRDPATRRKNLAVAVVGSFDGRHFVPEFEKEFDFGTDAYAFQAFADGDGVHGIAWLANWTDVNRKIDFETAMTLPRSLVLDEHGLRTPPIEAVRSLRRDMLAEGEAASGRVAIPDGQAEIIYEFAERGTRFRIDFEHPTLELALEGDGQELRLIFEPLRGDLAPRYVAVGADPRSIRIFLDIGSIEIFADDGRWTATKRLPSEEPVSAVRLADASASPVVAKVWRLEASSPEPPSS